MNRPNQRTNIVRRIVVILGVLAAQAHADISITPRVAYYFDNTSQRQSAINFNTPQEQAILQQVGTLWNAVGGVLTGTQIFSSLNSEQLAFPQYGATITVSFGQNESTQLAFSGLYGRSSGDTTRNTQLFLNFTRLGVTVVDEISKAELAHGNFTRLDLEATLQHRLNETFSIIGGMRGERTTESDSFVSQALTSTNFLNLLALQTGLTIADVESLKNSIPLVQRQVGNLSKSQWIYSARLGAAAYAPVGERHLFYVNGLLQMTRDPGARGSSVTATYQGVNNQYRSTVVFDGRLPSETTLGPDISVGYLFRFNDRFAVDMRYRALVYFPISGPYNFRDSRVDHGISLGFTSWFDRHK